MSTLELQKQSAVTLSNANELVIAVIREIAGNDISNSLNGSRITADVIQAISNQRIVKQLENKN